MIARDRNVIAVIAGIAAESEGQTTEQEPLAKKYENGIYVLRNVGGEQAPSLRFGISPARSDARKAAQLRLAFSRVRSGRLAQDDTVRELRTVAAI